jgi:hypothetical protein
MFSRFLALSARWWWCAEHFPRIELPTFQAGRGPVVYRK